AAQPTLGHVERAAALRFLLDHAAELLLRADEEHALAAEHDLPNRLLGRREAVERLAEVDDVDAVALGEDEGLHLRIPASSLVAEMFSGLQQLVETYFCHVLFSLFMGPMYAPVRMRRAGARRELNASRTGSACVPWDGRASSARPAAGHVSAYPSRGARDGIPRRAARARGKRRGGPRRTGPSTRRRA